MTSVLIDRRVRRDPLLAGVHPLDALAAIIIFASTLYVSPHALMVVGAGLLVLRHGTQFRQRDILLGVFILGSLANVLFHSGGRDLGSALSSMGAPLIFVTVMAGRVLPKGAMRVLILLICLEVLVGIFEFSTGRIGLTAAQVMYGREEVSSATSLLYQRRVLGLSANSSHFAEKIFLAILMVFSSQLIGRWRLVVLSLLAIGLYITFNRTAILSTLLCLGGLLAVWSLKDARRLPVTAAIVITVVVAAVMAIEPLLMQFTRGNRAISYSELARFDYLMAALSDLQRSPLFGNGSITWSTFDPLVGTAQHAHNSVMMMLVENGLILGPIMIAYVALGWRKHNAIYLLAMIVFSMTQYLFFWNISLSDILLHRFADGGKNTSLFKRRPPAGQIVPGRGQLGRPYPLTGGPGAQGRRRLGALRHQD